MTAPAVDLPGAATPSGAPAQPRPAAAVPTRHLVVDLAFTVVLTGIALSAFGPVYGGLRYLAVGLAGVAAGVLVGRVGTTARLPAVGTAALAVVALLVMGGPVALDGPGHLVPGPVTLERLASASVRGWTDVLTVLPPVGTSADLLVLPFLLGLAAAVTSVVVCGRTVAPWPPVVAPAAVLVVTLLLGTSRSGATTFSTAGFAVVAVAWFAARQGRLVTETSGLVRRAVAGAAVLALAAGSAVAAGTGAAGGLLGPERPRFVLRERFEPPFDPRLQPSPLADYRMYVLPGDRERPLLRDRTILRVDGLPEGALLRWAVMDEYDGQVWTVSGGGSPSAGGGVFRRVGRRIDVDATGRPVSYEVSVLDYGGRGSVWLPLAGAPQQIDVATPGAVQDGLRLDRTTLTGVVADPQGRAELATGDRYRVRAVLPPTSFADPSVHGLDVTTATKAGPLDVTLPGDPSFFEPFRSKATELAGDATTPYAVASALATALVERGDLSHGGSGEKQSPSSPGHYVARLQEMVAPDADRMTGDAEQFSALMAAMLRSLGVPARVAIGTVVDGSPEVRGADITAWVEVGVDGAGWVPFFPTPTTSRQKTPEPQTDDKPTPKEQPRPPVAADVDQPLAVDSSAADAKTPPPPPPPPTNPWLRRVLIAVAGTLGYAGLVVGVLLLLKRTRTRRRRAAAPHLSAALAWQEVVDSVRDAGLHVPARSTRLEAARFLPAADRATDLARAVDEVVYGGRTATPADADRLWQLAASARAAMAQTWTPGRRARAALSLASFRARA